MRNFKCLGGFENSLIYQNTRDSRIRARIPFQAIRSLIHQKHERQAEMFDELLSRSKRISRDAFADNFGGIADDVVEMLKSDKAQKTIQEARETMETSLPDSLRQIEFGSFNEAKELEKGEVAAIDGTFAFQCRSIQQDRQSALGLVASHIVGQC